MTAEVAVMNKKAVALAADSAVSSGDKIYNSANKLFALSKYEPVGVMIYNYAEFMGVPWETIIKVYREQKLGDQRFDTVQEYADHFLEYLRRENTVLFPESHVKDHLSAHFMRICYGVISDIQKDILQTLYQAVSDEGEVTIEERNSTISRVIANHYNEWKDKSSPLSITYRDIVETIPHYEEIATHVVDDVLEELVGSEDNTRKLKKICYFSAVKELHDHSGIVFAGFGACQAFPALVSYEVEAVFRQYDEEGNITDSLLKCIDGEHAEAEDAIVPFAQGDMVYRFTLGVDPSFEFSAKQYVERLFGHYAEAVIESVSEHPEIDLDTEILDELAGELREQGENRKDEFNERINKWKRTKFADPIMSTLGKLPKDELAVMAETLVNLTSFKKRVSDEEETVGGPIDVAVISKGDGFIWMNRKHYFDADKNFRFFETYYGSNSNQ
jgi:hypothetical protein